MKKARCIHQRKTDRTHQRFYRLSLPLLREDFERVTELMVSTTHSETSPSTHVYGVTEFGVVWEPMAVLEGCSYPKSCQCDIDKILLGTLGVEVDTQQDAPLYIQSSQARQRRRERFLPGLLQRTFSFTQRSYAQLNRG